MSSGVNRQILVGNIGKDPEVRYVQSGTAVCTLSVAVNERRKDGNDWKEHTEWFDVVTFGKTAENCAKYLKKGRQVYVEGRGQTRTFKDKEDREQRRYEVVAENVVFVGSGDGERGGGTDRF